MSYLKLAHEILFRVELAPEQKKLPYGELVHADDRQTVIAHLHDHAREPGGIPELQRPSLADRNARFSAHAVGEMMKERVLCVARRSGEHLPALLEKAGSFG